MLKNLGGLGFSDLQLFNQALVGKQALGIIPNLNSLASRILKDKYFKGMKFSEAIDKQGSLYLWKSIIWGRVVIEKGSIWRVGDGLRIKVFKDRRILRPYSFQPTNEGIDEFSSS